MHEPRLWFIIDVCITQQTPPFFSGLVHIMWSDSKWYCQTFLHSKGNCVFSMVSFSTSEAVPGWFFPPTVWPQPATRHLVLARNVVFLPGSPISWTYLLSSALRCNWKRAEYDKLWDTISECCRLRAAVFSSFSPASLHLNALGPVAVHFFFLHHLKKMLYSHNHHCSVNLNLNH